MVQPFLTAPTLDASAKISIVAFAVAIPLLAALVGRAFLRPPAELTEATTTRSSVRSDNHQGIMRSLAGVAPWARRRS